MGSLSEHFDISEFKCKCGCGGGNPHHELINMLEKLFETMNAKAIYINSGYRCPQSSVSVGGYADDMHTRNGAADIRVQKRDGTFYKSETIAEQAEKIGFKGIGLIPAESCHLDIRGIINYHNNFWFGNETTGENYETFAGMGEQIENVSRETNSVICEFIINGEKYKIVKG